MAGHSKVFENIFQAHKVAMCEKKNVFGLHLWDIYSGQSLCGNEEVKNIFFIFYYFFIKINSGNSNIISFSMY